MPDRFMFAALPLVAAIVFSAPTQAAESAAPLDRLPAQIVGVTGSGEAVVLSLSDRRSLKVGDVFEDGWVLQSLTPSLAVFVKGGERRQVGLNPAGRLDDVADVSDARLIVTATGAAERAAVLLASASSRRQNLETALTNATRNLERQQTLMDSGFGSRDMLLQARDAVNSARIRLGDLDNQIRDAEQLLGPATPPAGP